MCRVLNTISLFFLLWCFQKCFPYIQKAGVVFKLKSSPKHTQNLRTGLRF